MGQVESTSTRFAALGYRNFKLIWSGLIVSNMGTWMQNVANGWLVLQLTNSPLWLGLLGLSFALPMIILPPLAGAVVDRVNSNQTFIFYADHANARRVCVGRSHLVWNNSSLANFSGIVYQRGDAGV